MGGWRLTDGHVGHISYSTSCWRHGETWVTNTFQCLSGCEVVGQSGLTGLIVETNKTLRSYLSLAWRADANGTLTPVPEPW